MANTTITPIVAASTILLLYVWVGYPALLLAWARLRPDGPSTAAFTPTVCVIIAARNEEKTIRQRLENLLASDYPRERMEIIVASDASCDATDSMVASFAARDPRVRLLRSELRAGKSALQNLAATEARGEILFFTDANTRNRPDTLARMAAHFSNPEVGLVTATVHFGDPDGAVAEGQSLYWRYELQLRRLESELGILATASGQALALRRELFRPLPACYGDDCILPLDVRAQGYRVVQDSAAIVYDTMPHSISGELGTRARMTARNWTGTLARPAVLNPIRFPLTALGLVSHKLLRWLTPVLLAIIFLGSTALALEHKALVPWLLQVAFYAAAGIGWWRTRSLRSAGWFGYCFSFCLANLGFALGLLKVLRGQRIVAYESAK